MLKEQRGSVERFLAAQRERLDRAESDLAEEARRQHEQLNTRIEELRDRRCRVESEEAALHGQRQTLTLAQEKQQAELAQLDAQRARIDQKQVELLSEREDLNSRRLHTDGQRRRIARELRAQQATHKKNLDHRAAELDRQSAELDHRMAELDHRAVETPPVACGGNDDGSGEDFKRLYEMAIEDIRDMKSRIEEQEQQLAGACTSGAAAVVDSGGSLDWEAQKKRILATLESEFDASDEQATQERMEMKQVVQATERAMAAKSQEILQLRQQLDERASVARPIVEEPAATEPILENDKVIRKERQRLVSLQDQMQEKLRKAEIDISIERAKIARERAEIEEKLRAINKARGDEQPESGSRDEQSKPARGRWLAHLGIKDIED